MCTSIRLISKNNEVVTGRTNEFAWKYGSRIIFFPRGFEAKSGSMGDGNDANTFNTNYSILLTDHSAFLPFEQILNEGINEHGLGASLQLWHFHKYKEEDPTTVGPEKIHVANIAFYILGKYKNVKEIEEAKDELEQIIYWPKGVQQAGLGFHISFVDANGEAVILEPHNNGKAGLTITKNPLGVMTNGNDIDFHYKVLGLYTNLTTRNDFKNDFDGVSNLIKHTSLGGGLKGLPGDFTSESRFVRAAILTNAMNKPNNIREAVTNTFRVMGQFDFIEGFSKVILSPEQAEGYRKIYGDSFKFDGDDVSAAQITSALVVKDLTNLRIHVKTFENTAVRFVDLGKIKDQTEKRVIMEFDGFDQDHSIEVE